MVEMKVEKKDDKKEQCLSRIRTQGLPDTDMCKEYKNKDPEDRGVVYRHHSGAQKNFDSVGGAVVMSSEQYDTVRAEPTAPPMIYRQSSRRNNQRRATPQTSNTPAMNIYRRAWIPLVVAAIDIGTTFCTWAFGFVSDLQTDPSKMYSGFWRNGQAPTCLLLKRDETEYHFGYEAENRYKMMTRAELNDWFYFQRFKMSLYGKKAIDESSKLADMNGNMISALNVFHYCIQYLKEHLLKDLKTRRVNVVKDKDIQWVLTVPAIWNDAAKRFMRKAAEMAGINGQQLVIALEPEAASVYCRTSFTETPNDIATGPQIELRAGSSYLVLDAGGGTVDIAVHRILEDDRVEEVYQTSGGPWGGNTVNQKFVELLCDVFGEEKMNDFRREHIEDHTDLMNEFEVKKKEVDSENDHEKLSIRIPIELQRANTTVNEERDGIRISGDKLRISIDRVKDLFRESINSICHHLTEMFKNDSVKQCKVIMMVGGFSDCKLLQNVIEEAFPSVRILKPKDAGMAIVKGAVLYGEKPTVVSQRICKYTYGEGVRHPQTEYCNHPDTVTVTNDRGTFCESIFVIHATKGTPVRFGECTREVSGPSLDDGDHVMVMLFASPRERPLLVTEDDCFSIGQFRVPVSNGRESEISVRFMFGGTEIQVIAVDKDTGVETTHSLQYL